LRLDLDNDALEYVGGADLVFDVIGGDISREPLRSTWTHRVSDAACQQQSNLAALRCAEMGDVGCGSWPCENAEALRTRRTIFLSSALFARAEQDDSEPTAPAEHDSSP
jgi:hypothetical protein